MRARRSWLRNPFRRLLRKLWASLATVVAPRTAEKTPEAQGDDTSARRRRFWADVREGRRQAEEQASSSR
jgi:hypothetical protein